MNPNVNDRNTRVKTAINPSLDARYRNSMVGEGGEGARRQSELSDGIATERACAVEVRSGKSG